jgi:hypothetical protein
MPSKSKKQHDFMAAVANNPKFAKQAGVPQSVGEEFMKMDKKMKSYAKGGMSSCGTKSKPTAMKAGGMTMVKKGNKMVPDFAADGKGKMAMGGKVMPMMRKGGKVRGCGMARKGVRPARMV